YRHRRAPKPAGGPGVPMHAAAWAATCRDHGRELRQGLCDQHEGTGFYGEEGSPASERWRGHHRVRAAFARRGEHGIGGVHPRALRHDRGGAIAGRLGRPGRRRLLRRLACGLSDVDRRIERQRLSGVLLRERWVLLLLIRCAAAVAARALAEAARYLPRGG